MGLLFWITTISSVAVSLLSILSQTALWQQKEYRWDRFRSHLLSPQGTIARQPFILLAIAAIFVDWLLYLLNYTPILRTTGVLALGLFSAHHARYLYLIGLRRPKFTVKSISLLIASSIIIVLYATYMVHNAFPTLEIATLIFFIPGFVALAVALVNIPFALRKQQIIARARQLRGSLPNLTVIGITGSYGKTSTKYALEHILKAAGKNVVATREHHNTPIGVAQDMLALLKPDTEYFIAELSAYRRGEIKQLADLVQPKVGVVTAIGNQHLDLFGSRENIRQGKMELIDALPPDGIRIVEPGDAVRETAAALSIDSTIVEQTLASLPAFSQTLETRPGKNGSTVIDDSHSANEPGVLRAIKQLATLPQTDKRIVLLPLIELGQESSAVHQRIGDAVKPAGIKLYVYGTIYRPELGPGFYTNNPKQLTAKASAGITADSAILLENRLPDVVRKAFLA